MVRAVATLCAYSAKTKGLPLLGNCRVWKPRCERRLRAIGIFLDVGWNDGIVGQRQKFEKFLEIGFRMFLDEGCRNRLALSAAGCNHAGRSRSNQARQGKNTQLHRSLLCGALWFSMASGVQVIVPVYLRNGSTCSAVALPRGSIEPMETVRSRRCCDDRVDWRMSSRKGRAMTGEERVIAVFRFQRGNHVEHANATAHHALWSTYDHRGCPQKRWRRRKPRQRAMAGECRLRSSIQAANLLMLHRLDNAQLASVRLAEAKARTAVEFRRPTKLLEDAIGGGGIGLRVLTFGACVADGGVPITQDGKIVGGSASPALPDIRTDRWRRPARRQSEIEDAKPD